MAKETLHIKNMVCPRCITSVEDMLHTLPVTFEKVVLGEVVLNETLSDSQVAVLKERLSKQGFELLEDKKSKLVEAVKTHIIQYIEQVGHSKKISSFLAEKIGYDYSHISALFTETQGTTIEKYVILQKTERVKELLSYNELTLSQISEQLNYSSLAALSTQFKSVTGMTPSAFRSLSNPSRKSLDNLIP